MEIRLSRQAGALLKRVQGTEKSRLVSALRALQQNTFPTGFDIKKLAGLKDTYRIRVGKWRIIYEIVWEKRIIKVLKIDKRSRVYKRL